MFFLEEFDKVVKEKRELAALTDRDGARTLTYGELSALSDQIARRFVSRGVKQGDSVMLILPRISEYIACELALLKVGAVLVPLIPEYPEDRIDYIKKDAGASFLLREDFFAGIEEETTEPFAAADVGGDSRAMIIYTSGSTGNPKGVVYTRDNLDAHIKTTLNVMAGIDPLVYGAMATMSFCVTVEEYLRNFALGGHVHIISNEMRTDAKRLSDYYAAHHLTTGFISARILKDFAYKDKALKRVFVGSERVTNTYSRDFEIFCNYGQSETLGLASYFRIDQPYDNTPVGKALDGLEIKIMDSDDKEVADGEEGQICIIGDLPHEYNNLPEQTAKTFQKLSDGRILVHSGDIGKKLPDGNLLFLNRNDWMLKIHGQRVEPGEIESVMNRVDGVTGSIVKAFENEDGSMLLCGFYTESEPVDKEDIVRELAGALPNYMIPSAFVRMDAFPINANGKIDRKSIEKPDLSQLTVAYEKPVNQTEEAICFAMEKILGIDRIGRNDNFLQLGGNSLNAVELCGSCEIEGLAPQVVMLGQTPRKMAELLSENAFYPKPKLTVSNVVRLEYPLSMAQKYQYQVCENCGVTIDIIDNVSFFKLEEAVDRKRLKSAVETVVNAHPVYRGHIDMDKKLFSADDTPVMVEEVELSLGEFEGYRQRIYKRKRDLRKDPLFEAKLLHVSGDADYLFLCICHMVYDGTTVKNLFDGITAEYDGTPYEKEAATIFDLIDYETGLKKDTGLLQKAASVYDENYKDLKEYSLFEAESQYSTGTFLRVFENTSKSEIDAFLKKHGISILTLFQMAFELTVRERFQVDDFCYMNVYDGRGEKLLDKSHGVFARSVFMRSHAAKDTETEAYLSHVKEQYQKLVYYDVIDTFDVAAKYPHVRSGLTFNLRDMQLLSIELGGNRCKSEFLEEISAAYPPFSEFDFMINKIPNDGGYFVTIASTKVSKDFADGFVKRFEEIALEIIQEKWQERENDV